MAVLNEYTIYAEFTTAFGSRWAVQLNQDWEIESAKYNDMEVTLTPKRSEIIFKAVNTYCDLHDLDTYWSHEGECDDSENWFGYEYGRP